MHVLEELRPYSLHVGVLQQNNIGDHIKLIWSSIPVRVQKKIELVLALGNEKFYVVLFFVDSESFFDGDTCMTAKPLLSQFFIVREYNTRTVAKHKFARHKRIPQSFVKAIWNDPDGFILRKILVKYELTAAKIKKLALLSVTFVTLPSSLKVYGSFDFQQF